jgi:hypothetical protein
VSVPRIAYEYFCKSDKKLGRATSTFLRLYEHSMPMSETKLHLKMHSDCLFVLSAPLFSPTLTISFTISEAFPASKH